MSHIVAGEHMLKALETRFLKVQSTTNELERVSAFYDRIIELCVKNPPKNDCHLRALQEQVIWRDHGSSRPFVYFHLLYDIP